MNKTPKRHRDTKTKLLSKENVFNKLFDIARCRCKYLRRCNCSISSRVLPAEVAFLRDQRVARQMAMGGRGYVETSRRQSAVMRRQKRERLEGRDATDQPGPSSVATSLSIDTDLADEGDSSALMDTSDSSKSDGSESAMIEDIQESNNNDLTNTALAADRYGLSNPAVAAVINGFQMDIGRVFSGKTKLLVDPKKVWREWCRMRQSAMTTRDEQHRDEEIRALYFDGRHDQTSTWRGGDKTAEEHVAVVAEPGSEYALHFTPVSGRAIDQVTKVINVASGYGDSVRVLGCDGAAVNTGRSGGVCRRLKLIQGKPVHWFVCQLHSHELVLRELFWELDGKIRGPGSFQRICAS